MMPALQLAGERSAEEGGERRASSTPGRKGAERRPTRRRHAQARRGSTLETGWLGSQDGGLLLKGVFGERRRPRNKGRAVWLRE